MSQPEPRRKRALAEWVTFSISSLILASIIGLVVYSWLKVGEHPPVLTIERSGNVRQVEGNFYVTFTLTNKGGETADSVQVTAELRINGEVKESGEQHIDFLAGGEAEEGVFLFSLNPENGELILRVASYQKP
ncbi:TIGR02588 family protein [Gloeocapsa sp. PCC 73106]|uniref:TIGR02588 family protein n=1 Tax=Gloeocapsa sp. PCC 73106 TaxID=102232 RepID=UPI0002ACDF8B|nr:TIGR02588 family protein [Gloeocapsa sp. PCC 73106]ELR97872.1 TIGR02588 family protein [Gloeocapsa sp. PCC 73106]